MLALCYNYAMKWRFEYNASKCAVVICNSPDNILNIRSIWANNRLRLSPNTSHQFTHSIINMGSIESIIDYRKLQFYGQLRLPFQYLAKNIFHHIDRQCLGFIPDIYRLIRNYNLQYILDPNVKEGIFPSKLSWKIMLTSNIFRLDERIRLEFLTNVFPNYSVFSSGTVNCNNCSIWSVTKNTS